MKDISFGRDYYQKIIEKRRCGPYPFEKFRFGIGPLSQKELEQLWICHVNGVVFKDMLEKGHPVIATTGFGLTGPPHVGTISQILRAIRLQKCGIPVQIVLGDLDAYNGKATDLKFALELVPKYKRFIKKLGFDDSPPSLLRTQFEALEVLRTLYLAGNFITDEMFENAKEDIHEYYSYHNKIDDRMTYRIKLSLNLMVADFFDLYLQQGFESVAVFLGIDEYKYCGLAMDVLAKIQSKSHLLQEFSLAGMFSSTMKGLCGHPKMGKSFPGSGIDVEMSKAAVTERIMKEKDEHQQPEDNVVYQMISSVSYYSSDKIAHIYDAFNANGAEWQKIKEEYCDHLWEILSKWEDSSP